jgi:helix-turn-helix protein
MSTMFLDDQPCCPELNCSACPATGPLAVRVRGHRAEFGISLEEAAERAGMSLEQWEQLETGTWIPETYQERQAVTRGLDGADMTAVSFWAWMSLDGARVEARC